MAREADFDRIKNFSCQCDGFNGFGNKPVPIDDVRLFANQDDTPIIGIG